MKAADETINDRVASAFEVPMAVAGSRATLATSVHDNPDPTLWETTKAAFQRENLIGSAISDNTLWSGATNRVDPEFDVFDRLEAEGLDIEQMDDGMQRRFLDTHNDAHFNALLSDIRREQKNTETLERSGWTGVVLSMGAAVADPTILIPGGAAVKTGRAGYSAVRSGLKGGAYVAGATALQEAGLQATQETREVSESLLNIGGSAILGGLLGAGAAKLLSKAEWKHVSKAIEADLVDEVPNPKAIAETIVGRAQAAGAAAVEDIKFDDLGVGGPRAAQALANATASLKINPGVQTMLSPSAKTREIYARMVDNPIYTTMNMDGRSLGPDAENMMKRWQRGALGSWITDANKLFKESRKAGENIPRREFMQRIGRAMRRGDVDPDSQFITRAAQSAREKITDPLLKEAQGVNLLPDDVKTTTSQTYFSRMWNRKHLEAEEGRFKAIARKWFAGEVDRIQTKNEEIKVGQKAVAENEARRAYNKAFQEFSRVDDTLSKRSADRKKRMGSIREEENKLFAALQDRAPAQVVNALRLAEDGERIIDAIHDMRSSAAATKRLPKYPAIDMLRKAGGVDPKSPFAGELRNIGVTSKSFPGLFKNGGIGAADNFERHMDGIFASNRNVDLSDTNADIYVSQDEFLDAVASEVAGSPYRNLDDSLTEQGSADLAENAEQFLESIGLKGDALVRDVRARAKEVLGAENKVAGLDKKIAKLDRQMDEFDAATEKVLDRSKVSRAKLDEAQAALEKLEKELEEYEPLIANSKRIRGMIEYANAKADVADIKIKRAPLKRRIEELQRLGDDLKGDLEMELNAKEIDLSRLEEKLPGLEAKVARLEKFQPNMDEGVDSILDEADRAGYIDEVVNSVFNNLTGRNNANVPDWLVPTERGPLKARTFRIPDELVEDFLEDDAELVMRRHVRTMAAEVELARKFDSPDMVKQIEEVRSDYEQLRAKVQADKKLTAKDRQKEIERLTAYEKRDVTNIEAFRDLLRGTYRVEDQASIAGRMTRMALAWNYMRLLGGVTITSLADLSRLIGVHGVRATMTEGFPNLVKQIRGTALSVNEAKELGAVTEMVLNSRLATMAELADPYAHGSKFERLMDNATTQFSKLTGLGWWNDTVKGISSIMTQNRILRNAGKKYAELDQYEKAYMGFIGIDENMAGRINRQFAKHGGKDGSALVANTSAWDDRVAADVYAAALNKDTDRTIVTKSVADQPLWTRTNTGKLIFQFKSFGLASHQRVLIAGLQERPHRMAEMLVFGTALGMMIAYLKHLERGDLEKANALLENPGLWVTDGLDRTGILSLPFEVSNTLDKLNLDEGFGSGVPLTIKGVAQLAAGDKRRDLDVSRYASRQKFGAIGGPTVGLFEDLTTIAEQLSDGDLKRSGVNAMVRQIPGGSLPGIKTGLYTGVRPALQELAN